MKLYIGKKCFSYYQQELWGNDKTVNSWIYKSDLETIALMIMPGLLLQETSLNLKSKEISETLKERLSLWKNGQLDQIVFEGKTI